MSEKDPIGVCPDCMVREPTSWGQHDTGCPTAKRERAAEEARAQVLPAIAPLERPIIRHGDVAAGLFNDLRSLFTRLQQLETFERSVMESAKSPAAWMQLRQELAK